MRKDLIVAKFNEDVSWLDGVKDFNIIVYDKSNEAQPVYEETSLKSRGKKKTIDSVIKAKEMPKVPEGFVALPNVGREAHTYLTHIINNYATLADINVFTQGNPFDHIPDFIEKLFKAGKGYYNFDSIRIKNKVDNNEVTRAGAQIWGDNIASIIFDILSENGSPFIKQQIKNEACAILDVDYYAIFSVDRESIKKYPKSFYEKLLKLTIESPHGPYIMEFLWSSLYA